MRNFSQLIVESKKDYEIDAPSSNEVTTYINKTKNFLPDDVKRAIYLSQKLNLLSAEQLDEIRNARKPELKNLVDKLNVSLNELQDMWQFFKGMKNNYKLMPQYISKSEREMIEAGKMDVMDVLIDTETKAGQEAIVKQFAPLIVSLVNRFEGVSWMDRSDLTSACHEFLMQAIHKYKKGPDAKTGKASSFRSFVKNYISGMLKNEIAKHGHTLSGGSWYTTANGENMDAMRIDALMGKDGEINPDHWDAMGVEDKESEESQDKKTKSMWQKVYDILSKKFSDRDMSIFMSFYGLNGYQPMSGKELAKKYNKTYSLILSKDGPIKKIIRYLRENPKLMDLLNDLRDMYTESLLCRLSGTRDEIYEKLVTNEAYIILEVATKWSNKRVFMNTLNSAIKNSNPSVLPIVQGNFLTIDNNIKKERNNILLFLHHMYPAENLANVKDMDIIELMTEIQNVYHKFNK